MIGVGVRVVARECGWGLEAGLGWRTASSLEARCSLEEERTPSSCEVLQEEVSSLAAGLVTFCPISAEPPSRSLIHRDPDEYSIFTFTR